MGNICELDIGGWGEHMDSQDDGSHFTCVPYPPGYGIVLRSYHVTIRSMNM